MAPAMGGAEAFGAGCVTAVAGFAGAGFAGAGFAVTARADEAGVAGAVTGVLRTGSDAAVGVGFELLGQNRIPSRITAVPRPTTIAIGDRHQVGGALSWKGAAVIT